MVNWDDYYIHSSDDDLDSIDQTQLQRNNFIIGALALYLAYAEAEDIPLLASETFAHGGRRIANDYHKALRLINQSAASFKDAMLMIEQGSIRERLALNSMRVIAGDDTRANKSIDLYLKLVDQREKRLMGQLQGVFGSLYKTVHAPGRLTPAEVAASKKVPVNIESSEEYFSKRRRVRTGLHSIMRAETFNFVDGKRSYYDIYKAVKAESIAAGRFFYGTVKLEDVVRLLDANVQSGALKLKGERP